MDACLAKLMCDCKLKDFINGDRLAEAVAQHETLGEADQHEILEVVDQRMVRQQINRGWKGLVIIILPGHSGGRGTGSGTVCFRCKTDGQCKVHDDIGPVVATLGQIDSD